jgi:hypothetical protein
MRIYIKEKRGRRLYFLLPTRFVANRLSAHIISFALKKSLKLQENCLSSKDINRFFIELMRMKKKYPALELVDIESCEGEIVKVRL